MTATSRMCRRACSLHRLASLVFPLLEVTLTRKIQRSSHPGKAAVEFLPLSLRFRVHGLRGCQQAEASMCTTCCRSLPFWRHVPQPTYLRCWPRCCEKGVCRLPERQGPGGRQEGQGQGQEQERRKGKEQR